MLKLLFNLIYYFVPVIAFSQLLPKSKTRFGCFALSKHGIKVTLSLIMSFVLIRLDWSFIGEEVCHMK